MSKAFPEITRANITARLKSRPGLTAIELTSQMGFNSDRSSKALQCMRGMLCELKTAEQIIGKRTPGNREMKYTLNPEKAQAELVLRTVVPTEVSPPPRHAAALPQFKIVPKEHPIAAPEAMPTDALQVDLSPMLHQLANTLVIALRPILRTSLDLVVSQEIQGAIDRAGEQIRAATKGLDFTPAASSKAANQVRKRVTIVGLLQGQAAMIEHEFGKELQLYFVEANDAKGPRMKSHSTSSDHVITMVGFISHGVEDCIRSTGVKPLRVSGGMTRLRDVLTAIYADEPIQEAA